MPDATDTKPYESLRMLARHRAKRDPATIAQIEIADRIAPRIARDFGPEAVETAGLAFVVVGSLVGELIREGLDNPVVFANVTALIGHRMVMDARMIEEANRLA